MDKNKKEAINPINKKHNKCSQEKIEVHLHRITKTKPMNKYKWKRINCPLEKGDWKKIENNNLTTVLNVLYVKNVNIYPAYVSNHNAKCEKHIIILMISKRKRITLYCSKKVISIIKWNNVKTQW